jgi:hypothetical protein
LLAQAGFRKRQIVDANLLNAHHYITKGL